MKIKVKNVPDLILPKSAQYSDTGHDIIATTDPVIHGEKADYGVDLWKRVDFIEYGTNLFIEPQQGESEVFKVLEIEKELALHFKFGYTLIYPRSSISKYNLMLKNSVGILDHAYRGEIKLRFAYLWQPTDYVYFSYSDGGVFSFGRVNTDKIYKKGDRCGQLVAAWKEEINWNVVDSLGETARNSGGFGSTGT